MTEFLLNDPNRVFRTVDMGLEAEFEGIIKRFSDQLFPDWYYFDWKLLLESTPRGTRFDSLLIKKDFSSWWAVEVELCKHPVEHFEDQFEKQSNAIFDSGKIIDSLKAEQLDEEKLRNMLLRVNPGRLCIADDSNERLRESCRSHNFEFMAIAPLKSAKNDWAIQIITKPGWLKANTPSGNQVLTLQYIRKLDSMNTYQIPIEAPKGNLYTLINGDKEFRCQVFEKTKTIWVSEEVSTQKKNLKIILTDPVNLRFEIIDS